MQERRESLYVCTTGFEPGPHLNQMAQILHRYGHQYEACLSAQTRVLVANTRRSAKYQQAAKRPIAIVTKEWITAGQCSWATVGQYRLPELMSMEVVTSALSETNKELVRKICEKHGATFATTLSKTSSILVVPRFDVRTEKFLFAAQYHIPVMTLDGFSKRHGKELAQNMARASCRSNVVAVRPTVAAPAGGAATTTKTGQSSAARPHPPPAAHPRPLPHPIQGMHEVVCYLTPPQAVNNEHVLLCQRLGVRRVPLYVKDAVTHVVVLGKKLEEQLDILGTKKPIAVVTYAWLCACVREHRYVPPATKFSAIVTGMIKPIVITLGSISSEDRQALTKIIKKLGGGYVQEDLRIGVPNGSPIPPTTHMVLPAAAVATSNKAKALYNRSLAYGQLGCNVIDVEWISASATAKRWLDPTPFSIDMHGIFGTTEPAVELPRAPTPPPVQPVAVPPAVVDHHIEVPPPVEVHDTDAATQEKSPEGATPSEYSTSEQPTNGTHPYGVTLSLEALVEEMEGRTSGQSVAGSTTSVAQIFQTAGSSVVPESAQLTKQVSPLGPPSLPPPWLTVSTMSRTNISTTTITNMSNVPEMPKKHNDAGVRLSSSHQTVRAPPMMMMGGGHSAHQKERQAATLRPGTGKCPAPKRSGSLESQVVVYEHNLGGLESQWSLRDDLPRATSGDNRVGQNRFKPQRVISLLLAKAVRDELQQNDITTLVGMGIIVADSVESCTHYVLSNPCKTETFLCAVAAGKWVVDKSFVHRILVAGSPVGVKDEEHEWREAKLPPAQPNDPNHMMLRSLLPACLFQRKAGGGRYKDWVAVLVCDDPGRQKAFNHVLDCGGCKRVTTLHSSSIEVLAEPFNKDTTHVLCDDGCLRVAPRIRQLVDQHCVAGPGNVLVQRLEFLVHCLSNPGPPQIDIYDAPKRSATGKKRPHS